LTSRLIERRATLINLVLDFFLDSSERWKPTYSARREPAWTVNEEPATGHCERPLTALMSPRRYLLPLEISHEKILHQDNATKPVLKNRFSVFQCFH
jgi:hypothetical protein